MSQAQSQTQPQQQSQQQQQQQQQRQQPRQQQRATAPLSQYKQRMFTTVHKQPCQPPTDLAQALSQFCRGDSRTINKQLLQNVLPKLTLFPSVDLAVAGSLVQLLSQQVQRCCLSICLPAFHPHIY